MNEHGFAQEIELGIGGPIIAPLGFGTWAWGDRILWGYGRENYTDDDLKQAFDTILDAGINFFDTAEVYGSGRSETLLGRFINSTDKTILAATKYLPYPWRRGKYSLRRALESSLERLGCEYVDLYQIHWPVPTMSIERLMDQMADAVQAGLVRNVGVSNYNIERTKRAYARLAKHDIPLFSNQIEYSLLHRSPERNGLIDLCNELNILVIAYSPLAKGFLTGKYSPQNPPPGSRGIRTSSNFLAQAESFSKLLRRIGENHDGRTPSQVALNWLISKGTLPIPGVKNMRQAKDNLGALGWHLTEEEITLLDKKSSQIAL
jgi:aryl-alcohol dehydrogenase-like predicted oxidoreductase